jgi:hypothetical protein
VIKSGKMRTGNVARIGQMKVVYNTFSRKPEGKKQLGDIGDDRRIILKWILMSSNG